MLDTGYQMLDAGYCIIDTDVGFIIVG